MLWLVGSILVWATSLAQAQIFDSFDASRPKFRLWQSDANAQLVPTRKTDPGVENIEVAYGSGSYVYLLYPIEPCAVINDLSASLNIRSAQSGLKIGFRVIFPRSTDPATQDPIAEVLYGTPSEGSGAWSNSTIRDIVRQFDERVRFLRTRYGPSIDLQDAYVDGVVLSVYTWPGTLKLQVDELRVEGMVAPSVTASQLNGVIDGANEWSHKTVQQQLESLQSNVPRWIQHQGESLDYLQSLGFNAILSNRANDPLVIEQAARTSMAVIAPPPETVPTDNLSKNYEHVHGWLLGMALDQSHLEQTRNRVSKLTRFPQSLSRPMIGEAMEMYGSYSRLSDWLAVPLPLATRVRSAQEAATIMQSDLRPMAGRSIPLTSIVTQMPNDWIVQKATAVQLLGGETARSVDYDLLQVRMQVYRSMMQGARGWIFRSGIPLDSGDPTSIARAQGYAGINQEIELLKPWIRSGHSAWRSIELDSKNHLGAILETPNSQLAIIMAAGPMDQVCSVAPSTERIQVTLPVSGQLRNVFRITHGTMETIRPQQTANGLLITIEQPALIEQIVTVVDPKPVAYLREQLTLLTPKIIESRMDITEQVLEIAQMTLIEQQIPARDARWEEIRRAQSLHREATQHLARSNTAQCLKSADQALLVAQRIIRNSWEQATSQFSSVQSSPLVASPLSLPVHWQYNRLLAGRRWQSLSIAGVPWTDGHAFVNSGWNVDRRLTDTVHSECGIGPNGTDGSATLFLVSRSLDGQPIPSGYAGAAMRVSSPPIAAPQGAMVHIRGMVRVESPPGESQSGLLVCDSAGGEALGQLISSADQSPYAWRRFELIRFVTSPDGIQLHFETRGQMNASISGLQAEMIMPTQSPLLPTRPLEPNEISEDQGQVVPMGRQIGNLQRPIVGQPD